MPHKDQDQGNAYSRAYYKANRRVLNARKVLIARDRRHERRARLKSLKEASPCTDCGNKFPYYVMDFDHRDPLLKVADVSTLVKRFTNWGSILAEIAKCDLVCARCHRLRTYHGSNSYKTRRFEQHKLVLDELKETTPCLDCVGYFKPCQMDFDHLHSKEANVGRLVGGSSSKLEAELRKCHLVCVNCHRIRENTGVRCDASKHSARLGDVFVEVLARTAVPQDQRFRPFPVPHLLGKVPDKELSEMTGISRPMVAWYRRKAGIILTRQGERVAA
jgi:hypothetical protein